MFSIMSKNVYQSQALARLTLAQAELDFSSYRRQLEKNSTRKRGKHIYSQLLSHYLTMPKSNVAKCSRNTAQPT